ncbi:hypothetical protein [Allokutzneria sp. NRRL B-24872]|uniref:hypothetical protein n=1 Tax=Allokutzneria sp. NRRL B-24872 TaxID=1137961 RepID=UPI0011787E3B|nr:hypothetical protein [Allokutzneria sp. NRRL B-24872]
MRISATQTQEFGQTLVTGTRRYNDMVTSVRQGGFLSDADMELRRATYRAHYTAAPSTKPDYSADNAQEVSITGFPSATYINTIDTGNAEIRAWLNVNPVPAPPWALLKTSDIQFLQYEMAFGNQRITPLSRIVRMNVASGNGSKMVLHMSQLNPQCIGMALRPDDTKQWQAEGQAGIVSATTANFFHAFLGTDNGASSIWLVREHGRRLGITGIEKVVVLNAQNVAIHFTHT